MRILVVEDDSVLGDAVAVGLRQSGHAVDWVTEVGAAHSAIGAVAYDGVVLDLSLPRGEGLSVLEAIRAQGDRCAVIIATARDSVRDRIAGLDRGADDYIVKPFDLDELAARLRAVQRRQMTAVKTVFRLGNVEIDLSRRIVTHDGVAVDLTAREFMLIEALVAEPGRIVSKLELEDKLYGFGEEISSNAVEVFVHNLRRKLGEGLIRNIRGRGYCLITQD